MPGRREIGRRTMDHNYEQYVDRGAYIPSPEQIAHATARIRSRWNKKEHERRLGITVNHDIIPVVKQPQLSKRYTHE